MDCPVYLSGGASRVNLGAKKTFEKAQEVFPGIVYSCIEIDKNIPDPILVFEVDLGKINLVLATDSLSPTGYRETYRPLLMINGGFFKGDFGPAGLIMKAGDKKSDQISELSGVLIKNGAKVKVDFIKNVSPEEFEKAEFVLQAGPLIIEPGGIRGIRAESGKIASRTAIGVTKSEKVLVFTSFAPISLFKLQNLALNNVKDIDALLNLDGETSTMLFMDCRKCKPQISLKYMPHPAIKILPNVILLNPKD